MKTIVVDHDTPTEISALARFNPIIPILRNLGAEDFDDGLTNDAVDGIITPRQIPEYLNTDYNIIYALTAREPTTYEPADWLSGISEEIPTNIIELANAGKLHIAFFVGEIITITPAQILGAVDPLLEKAGINKESITVYVPNFKIPDLGVSHIKFISIFEMSYFYDLKIFERKRKGIPLNKNIIQHVNLNPRSKKFTCLNHLSKQHRLCFAASIFNAGKHTDGYFSYHQNPLLRGFPEGYFKTINPYHFMGRTPFLVDTKNGDGEVNYHDTVKKPFFADAYWNFVTESFYVDYCALTEKTFKPIANLQPFIIVGATGSLKALRDLGYETFNDVIDESYDHIEDPDRRMKLLVEVALRLIDMTDKQHIRMMTKIKPVLEHNQQVFLNKHWKDFL